MSSRVRMCFRVSDFDVLSSPCGFAAVCFTGGLGDGALSQVEDLHLAQRLGFVADSQT